MYIMYNVIRQILVLCDICAVTFILKYSLH